MSRVVAREADYSREDVQVLADLRMIALALLKRQEQSHTIQHFAIMSGAREIAAICTQLILAGPREYHAIVEPTVPLEAIQHELRESVFGRKRDDFSHGRLA